MPNLSGTTQFFTKSAENTIAMTLGGSVTGGVSDTVPVNNMSNYTDGDNVAFVVDPGTPSLKQVFTGQKSGTNVINVVWTEGTNQAHSSGATVIDYVTATHWDLLLQGLLTSHTPNGSLKTGIVGSSTMAPGAVAYANLLSTIFSGQVTTYTNTGSAGGSFSYINLGGVKILYGLTTANSVGTGGSNITVNLPSSFFSSIKYASATVNTVTVEARQNVYISNATTSAIQLSIYANNNGATQTTALLIIGA